MGLGGLLILLFLEKGEWEGHTAFCARVGDGDFDGPALPADLVVAAHGVPGLAPALFEKLDGDLAAATAAAAGVVGRGRGAQAEAAAAVGDGVVRLVALRFELAHQGGDALVDEGLDLGFGDVGELEPEDVAGLGDDGGKIAEEEDGVKDA